jgi:hypothetical protein
MVDEPSSLGEAVMLGAGSIEHRELIYYTVSKSTTFEPPGAAGRGLESQLDSRWINETTTVNDLFTVIYCI